MENDKTIDALNELVEINNDRIDGYENASENTEERELKGLFSTFEQTSQKCVDELNNEINKLGGKATEGTTASGKFFRAWMDVKSALSGKDRKTILSSCEYGEKNAVEVYNDVLENNSVHLNQRQQELIKSQLNRLKSDQSTIKSMQNTLVETQ